MAKESVFEQITNLGVVPVIAIESVDDALPLADALLEGGLPVAEITFRTTAAAKVIETLTKNRPELLVGAGTVLTEENLRAAVDCGATFGVAPGLNPDILAAAASLGLPFVPGVVTPSEIERAVSMGARILKFFPAGAFGGVSMLKALGGPYAHTGIRFMPTGGVNEANLADYLAFSMVGACGGTWIAKKDDFAAGRWSEIRDRCRAARDVVQQVRGAGGGC